MARKSTRRRMEWYVVRRFLHRDRVNNHRCYLLSWSPGELQDGEWTASGPSIILSQDEANLVSLPKLKPGQGPVEIELGSKLAPPQ